MNDQNFFAGDHFAAGEYQKTGDIVYSNSQFVIDDLLVDFPNHDDVVLNDEFFENVVGNSADSENVTVVDSCNSSVAGSEALFSGNVSSRSFSESQFSGVELCLPYDDVAELEWLSSFTQESFTTVDIQTLQLISAAKKSPATDTSSSGTTPIPHRTNSQIFQTAVFVPAKPRTKRSRTGPSDWTSRILHLRTIRTKPPSSNRREPVVLEPSVMKTTRTTRCLHCGSEKTPQWRTGPLGPKTLCNACGVRYKSGRLVPEYRPAASPTYVSAKHSNSHRKVMEIRRQKEIRIAQNGYVNRSSVLVDDCLIDCGGPGFMDMI